MLDSTSIVLLEAGTWKLEVLANIPLSIWANSFSLTAGFGGSELEPTTATVARLNLLVTRNIHAPKQYTMNNRIQTINPLHPLCFNRSIMRLMLMFLLLKFELFARAPV